MTTKVREESGGKGKKTLRHDANERWRERRREEMATCTSTREGRKALAVASAQRATDVFVASRCDKAIRVRAYDGADDDGMFKIRVIVDYRDDYEIERAVLERVMRLKTSASSLCAGGTPPARARLEDGASDDRASIEELAAILGVCAENVDDVLRADSATSFLPARFHELLGMRRVYEVKSNDVGRATRSAREFIVRVAGGSWSHSGLIEGAITIEVPMHYDITIVNTPTISSLDAPGAMFTLQSVLKPAFRERLGFFVYVNDAEAPSDDVWETFRAARALENLLENGTKVCLCWPLDDEDVIGASPTIDEIEAFTARQHRLLKSSDRHWRSRLGNCARDSQIPIVGDMATGISLAFVCVDTPCDSEAYKFDRLAYAVESLFEPEDASSQPDEAPAKKQPPPAKKRPPPMKAKKRPPVNNVIEKSREKPKETPPPPPEPPSEPEQPPTSPAASVENRAAVPPKKRIMAPKRKCTINDPFAFEEIDLKSSDEGADDAQITPMLGKFAKAPRVSRGGAPKSLRTALSPLAEPNAAISSLKSPQRTRKRSAKTIITMKPPLALRAVPKTEEFPRSPTNSPANSPVRTLRSRANADNTASRKPWWEA